MHTKPNNILSNTTKLAHRQYQIFGIVLAFLPLISFLGQYFFSIRAGTLQIMFHHPTVMVVDWVFVPLNFFVVRVIEWHRGGRLFLIICISALLNLLTYAFWQFNGSDSGHMITKTGIVLPAGWVHFGFSIVETVLLIAFVFCRKVNATGIGIVTILATIYFLTMGICGFVIHDGFIVSDVVTFVCGFFFVLAYLRLIRDR